MSSRSWWDAFLEKVTFPGWVVHPFILLGVLVLGFLGVVSLVMWWLLR